MTLSKDTKRELIEDNKTHDTDTGSPEVQISLLTRKIKELSEHLKIHRKDKHSRRGLLGMVSKRRRHLNYLKKKDNDRYEEAMKQVKQ